MKFQTLISQRSREKTLGIIAGLSVMVSAASMLGFYIISQERIEKVEQQRIVIDSKNNPFFASIEVGLSEDRRRAQIKEAIRMAYRYVFAFDEGSFYDNLEMGSYLFPQYAQLLKDRYNDQNTYSNLKSFGIRSKVYVDDIELGYSEGKFMAIVTARQEVIRANSSTMRNINTHFEIKDVSVHELNPFGLHFVNVKEDDFSEIIDDK
tara:strand:+ start:489 stop:1109 length:621 start_codon:yes stop_codon:yes gene_type:complete